MKKRGSIFCFVGNSTQSNTTKVETFEIGHLATQCIEGRELHVSIMTKEFDLFNCTKILAPQ
jgi:hypothetical protein